MKFLSSEKLSEHKYKTPEGYLVCVDAILARTGKQEYRKNEVFADSDDDGIIEVDRKAEEVFSPATLASFENKPITVEHPDENVNTENYKDYSVGFVRDVHKGEADGQEVMLGTLVITDEQTIEEIENGEHVELSCGYDCDIIDEENPQQRNIRGNHVALCEQGRAGIARIVDSDTIKDNNHLVNVYNRAGKLLYSKRFNSRAEVDRYANDLDNLYDMTAENDVYKNNRGSLDTHQVWKVIIDDAGIHQEQMAQREYNKLKSERESIENEIDRNEKNPRYDIDYAHKRLDRIDKEIEELKKIFEYSIEDTVKDVNPREGEDKADFISRFMEETKEEYPDAKQRLAVAYSYWEKRNQKDSTKKFEVYYKSKGKDCIDIIKATSLEDAIKTHLKRSK